MSPNIRTLKFIVRTENVLKSTGIETVEELMTFIKNFGKAGLLTLPNLGIKSADEIMKWFSTAHQDNSAEYGLKNDQPSAADATLRDYFAAKAMQASLRTAKGGSAEEAIEKAAKTAYLVADAMLRAREATP